MNVPTITMPRSEAKAAFLKYREAVKARHDSEDLAIMRGYRALARGRTISDPQILDPLRAARDQARLALENYRKGRAPA